MPLLIILLSAIFSSSVAADSDQPTTPPPGFEEYLASKKQKDFKLKIVIRENRKPASYEIKKGTHETVETLKAGMYKMSSNCNLRSEPTEQGVVYSVVSKNKKVWVEHHDALWGKVYRKKGVAFISRTCFE